MNPEIDQFITENRASMLSFLEELVLIQSFSKNIAGVNRVGDRITREMTEMGFTCEQKEESELGHHVIARSPAVKDHDSHILITGHMDTVFPEDSPFNWYKDSEDKCFGPGVADMKGGLVVGIYALKALIHTGDIRKLPITFIFNSDEEIGSPGSRQLIRQEAKTARMAYVLEAGGFPNSIVTGRKGNLRARLTIKGKAGHAAFAGTDKASAVLELAHKTLAIEAMNAPDKGVSANVGTITGGIGPNTVADHAEANLDFRFPDPDMAAQVHRQLDAISAKTIVPGTQTSLDIISGRPPMPCTPEVSAMFKRIEALSLDLGMPVSEEIRQGVSDANIIASEGVPVIDGLGPVGAKDHSEDEFIEKASLWERSLLFANILAQV